MKKIGAGLLFLLAVAFCLSAKPVSAAPAWMSSATEINLEDYMSGTASWTSSDKPDYDSYYELYVPAKMKVTLEGGMDGEHPFEVYILTSKGYVKKHYSGSSDFVYDPGDNTTYFSEKITLTAGTYYIDISKSYYDDDVTGLDNKLEWYMNINSELAKKPAIKKIKRSGKTKAIITLKKYSGCDGFLIYMKKGKKGSYKLIKNTWKTKFTYKKLKRKKTYYFRICTYVKSGSSTIYSPYSKVKSFKTK